MKKNISRVTVRADQMLESLENPQHRATVENYWIYAPVEAAGARKEIWRRGLIVDDPALQDFT
jgi:hypothetical protein